MGLLMATLAATIGFSLLVHLGVERRIETLRAAIKRRRRVSSFAWRSRSGAAPALPAE
jgi:peptidoglycan/LPS O-acetylase OafA/YrhL